MKQLPLSILTKQYYQSYCYIFQGGLQNGGNTRFWLFRLRGQLLTLIMVQKLTQSLKLWVNTFRHAKAAQFWHTVNLRVLMGIFQELTKKLVYSCWFFRILITNSSWNLILVIWRSFDLSLILYFSLFGVHLILTSIIYLDFVCFHHVVMIYLPKFPTGIRHEMLLLQRVQCYID